MIEAGGGAIRLASGDRLDLPRAASFADGARIVLAVRPEHVRLHATPAPGAIGARRILAVPQGPLTLHDLALSDGVPLKAVEQRVPDAPAAIDAHKSSSPSISTAAASTPPPDPSGDPRHAELHDHPPPPLLAGMAGLAATPILGPGRARAAGSIVAAAFPSSWEDAYRAIIAPMVKQRGTELVVSPALAQDQLAKLLASQGSLPSMP